MINQLAAIVLFFVLFSSTTQAPDQSSDSPSPQKTVQILVEREDHVMVELVGRELQDMAAKIGVSIKLIDQETKPYDLRILLASTVGSKSGTCTGSCTHSHPSTDASIHHGSSTSTTCSVTITIYYTSAVVIAANGKLQSTHVGVGHSRPEASQLLARKLISIL